jgi:hypothetical protein
MARGWESKSIESQIEDRRAAREASAAIADADANEAERQRKLESLERSRRRVLHDLESAATEVHRAALTNALGFLDAELEKLK